MWVVHSIDVLLLKMPGIVLQYKHAPVLTFVLAFHNLQLISSMHVVVKNTWLNTKKKNKKKKQNALVV